MVNIVDSDWIVGVFVIGGCCYWRGTIMMILVYDVVIPYIDR